VGKKKRRGGGNKLKGGVVKKTEGPVPGRKIGKKVKKRGGMKRDHDPNPREAQNKGGGQQKCEGASQGLLGVRGDLAAGPSFWQLSR